MNAIDPARLLDDHDWDLATCFCRACGASMKAVAEGERGRSCDPGVIGISHLRASARLRSLIPSAPFSIGGFRFPDGSLDDCSGEDDPGPAAA